MKIPWKYHEIPWNTINLLQLFEHHLWSYLSPCWDVQYFVTCSGWIPGKFWVPTVTWQHRKRGKSRQHQDQESRCGSEISESEVDIATTWSSAQTVTTSEDARTRRSGRVMRCHEWDEDHDDQSDEMLWRTETKVIRSHTIRTPQHHATSRNKILSPRCPRTQRAGSPSLCSRSMRCAQMVPSNKLIRLKWRQET